VVAQAHLLAEIRLRGYVGMLALLLASWIPLVNALIRLLSEGVAAAALAPQVAVIGIISVALLAGGVAVVHQIERR